MSQVKVDSEVTRLIGGYKVKVVSIQTIKEFGKSVTFYRLRAPTGYEYMTDAAHFEMNYR